MASDGHLSPASDMFGDDPATAHRVALNGDEEDDVVQRGARRRPAARKVDAESEAGDLFGDAEGVPAGSEQPSERQLDDEDLDSGDDAGRTDRVADEVEQQQYEQQERLAMDIEIPRQPLPEPSDGEMYLLKVPDFLSLEPQAWHFESFQPPVADHHSKTASSTFSAYNTALSTIRWRPSPSEPSDLQSNARINRWSDGSLTLQLASDPPNQYEIDGNALAPPQHNPPLPTPTSLFPSSKPGRQTASSSSEDKQTRPPDAYTYLIVPVQSAESLRVAHKFTAGLSLKQTASATDEALERLSAALAQAANATKVGGATGTIELTKEDPEARRRQAEATERAIAKERKKREAAGEREQNRRERVVNGRGGSAYVRGGGVGISVDMLEEDGVGGGGGRPRAPVKKAKAKRANSEYSSDEDFGRLRGMRGEEDYDQEDGFVNDDEEEEEEGIEEEEEEDEDDGIVEERRGKAPKRDRPAVVEKVVVGDEADAEGEVDEEVVQQQVKTKRRRIVEDDDDE